MRTINYGPESNPEGIKSMSIKGPALRKEVKEQFMSLLVKNFMWSQQMTMAMRALLNE